MTGIHRSFLFASVQIVVEGVGRDRKLPTSSCKVQNEAVNTDLGYLISERDAVEILK